MGKFEFDNINYGLTLAGLGPDALSAALTVCDRLPPEDAIVVLDALGLRAYLIEKEDLGDLPGVATEETA